MADLKNNDYKEWILEIKNRIYSVQAKASIAVNSAVIEFYFFLGKSLSEKENIWGSKLLEQISLDLKIEFPDMKGFSVSNLKYCKNFYLFYADIISQQAVDQFIKQMVFQIPWGHNILIFTKSKDTDEALFYLNQTKQNNWGRDILAFQIKSDLYNRSGKALTNFKNTLPEHLSDLAQETFKDPYNFDFMCMSKPYIEKDIENQLIKHLTRFLLELGKGFAFVGQQFHLKISEKDYYIDLLFYHIKLRCYVVIELKNNAFKPEYTGKLNFYLSAVDSLVKQNDDNPTIGLLLCRDKDTIEAEFALRDIGKPMGVSEFTLLENLPETFKSNLPTIEEIEQELTRLD